MDIKTYQVNKTYTDKEVKKVNDRITTLTIEQQQDGEVIEARKGEVSLKAKIDSIDAQLAQSTKQVTYKNNLPRTLNNVSVSDGSYNKVQWMTEDDVIYYSYGTTVRESSDYGKTINNIYTFDNSIAFVREIDGELLVGTRQTAEQGGQIFKSSNGKTSWTMVLQLSPGAFVHPGWTVWVENEIVLLGEYGLRGSATKVYMSTDKGISFREILDFKDYTPLPDSTHVHGVAYDKWFDRIWAVHGDGNTMLSGNTGVYYSDDLGATWKKMHVPCQVLTVFPFEDRVIFTSDSPPNGIYSYERGRKEEEPTIEFIYALDDKPYLTYLSYFNYKKDDSSPLFMSWKLETGSSETTDVTKFILASYNGRDWVEIWRDSQQHEKGDSFIVVVAPTKDNKLIGSMDFDNREWAITKIEADYSFEVNKSSSKLKDYNGEVDIRDLGVIGDGRDESGVLYNAIHYCARNSKVLVIPKDVSVTVRTVEVNGLNNFRMKVLGEIKLVDLVSGASATPIKFTNCTNLIIDEMNVNGNGSGQGSTSSTSQNMIALSECSDVTIGKLKVKNTVGRALFIIDSTRILVDSLHNDSKNIGTSTLFVRNSKSLRFKDVIGEMGDIANYSVSNITIDSTEGKETSNIVIEKAMLRTSGRASLSIVGADNIKINSYHEELSPDFNHGNAKLINIINTSGVVIKGKIKGYSYKSDAVFVDDSTNVDIDLNISTFNRGAVIGETTLVSKSKFTFIFEEIDKTSLTLGELSEIDFNKLIFGDTVSKNPTTAYPYVRTFGTANWSKVRFIGGKAKRGNGNPNALFVQYYSSTMSDVVFDSFDLSDWMTLNTHQMFRTENIGGIRRINCLGYNYRNSIPSTLTVGEIGETVYNLSPSAGGSIGWICVEPKTWKTFGTIEN